MANSLHDLARKVACMDMKALEAGMREGEVVSGLRPLPGTSACEVASARSAVQRRCFAWSRATQRSQ
ncbi:MAG: hypothetical protein A3F74_14170 [Betaproteobacteria bacterium RIFCSPLOWO2_12_FULL_62_58]|nr:MAG: hypothetical protein A3F74_14170 [Betaproteobacteria bacterium RIFCSPLOWO2_12_FULL_62_58]